MGSVSIHKNGNLSYQNSIGFANIEENLINSVRTQYRIGSFSKTFTAVLVMQWVEAGKLTLETTLDRFYPEIGNAEKITIAHLLNHRSGIFNLTNDSAYADYYQLAQTKKELLDRISSFDPVFEPGSKYEYSNSNYVLLSFILADISNRSFGELLKESISKPMDLKYTFYQNEPWDDGHLAKSYIRLEDWQALPSTDPSVPLGAGGIVSNPEDLNHFLQGLFTGKILQKSTLARMMIIRDGYGLGLMQVPFYEKKAFGHAGKIDGFDTMSFYFPEEDVAVSYCSNGLAFNINDLLIGILSIYFGRDYSFPEFENNFEVSEANLDQYLGTYSSPTFPLKITITKNAQGLVGQATGQPSFPLEAFKKDQFRFQIANLEIEFFPLEKRMVLKQGLKYELFKEE